MKRLERELGVELFVRTKNTICLSETGERAVALARDILEQMDKYVDSIRSFDKQHKTLHFAVCAPRPVIDIEQFIDAMGYNWRLEYEILDDAEIIQGVLNEKFSFGFVHRDTDIPAELFCRHYRDEKLYIIVPRGHPLEEHNSLTFSQIDGYNLLVFDGVGVWEQVCRDNLPNSHFVTVNDAAALKSIVQDSSFPSFTTDIAISAGNISDRQTAIKITDENGVMPFYLVGLERRKSEIQDLLPFLRSKT